MIGVIGACTTALLMICARPRVASARAATGEFEHSDGSVEVESLLSESAAGASVVCPSVDCSPTTAWDRIDENVPVFGRSLEGEAVVGETRFWTSELAEDTAVTVGLTKAGRLLSFVLRTWKNYRRFYLRELSGGRRADFRGNISKSGPNYGTAAAATVTLRATG
jgi:hypothetical protein